MIDELTIEQEKILEETTAEWLAIFDKLHFDEEKSRELITFIYELSELQEPVVVFLDSPWEVQLACNIFFGNFYCDVSRKVSDKVMAKVRNKVSENSKVDFKVSSKVSDKVSEKVRNKVEDNVGVNMENIKHFSESSWDR